LALSGLARMVCELARTLLGADHPVPWEELRADYHRIRDAIADVVPGCTDYNTRVRQPDGFQLPHPPRDSREFPTITGKANFAVYPLEWVPVPPGRLVLQTLRSHDQYNTTIYGLDDRYRGVKGGRRVVFVNPADIASLGLAVGMRVDLISEFTDGRQSRGAPSRGLPSGAVLDSGGQCGIVLPGDQPARPSGSHRGEVEHPGVQGGGRQAGAHARGRN
jgi:anaerobic selenocysteine-containing dehydrogenase